MRDVEAATTPLGAPKKRMCPGAHSGDDGGADGGDGSGNDGRGEARRQSSSARAGDERDHMAAGLASLLGTKVLPDPR